MILKVASLESHLVSLLPFQNKKKIKQKLQNLKNLKQMAKVKQGFWFKKVNNNLRDELNLEQ